MEQKKPEETGKKQPCYCDGQYYQVDHGSRPYGGHRMWIWFSVSLLALLVLCVTILLLQTRLFTGRTIEFTDSGSTSEADPAADMLEDVLENNGAGKPEEAENALPEQSDTDASADSAAAAGGLQIASSDAGTLTLQQIYQKSIASVVSITASGTSTVSSGTGIVFSEDGYIITNCHVIEDADTITVKTDDGTDYQAVLVGSDEISDLAVLKIEASGLTPAEFGSSDDLQVGDSVVAIGDPLGSELRGSMTCGIISAINRDIEIEGRVLTLIQTDAALNEGNSGGPLIDMQGRVIGINTMKISSSYNVTEGLGFAIPFSVAEPVLEELLNQGYVSGRPTLQIEGTEVPLTAQFYYRWPAGVYLREVDETSDLYAQGVRAGDIIVKADGETVSDMDSLNEIRNRHSAGDTMELTVYHSGAYYDLTVTLAEQTG